MKRHPLAFWISVILLAVLLLGGVQCSSVQAQSTNLSLNSNTVTMLSAVSTVQFSVATYSVNENGGSATIQVTLSSPSATTVTVNYATSNGTATAGQDYTAASGMLTFNPGETTKSFEVLITNDSVVEQNETVNLTLSNSTGGAILGTPGYQATIIIIDDDVPLAFSCNNVTEIPTAECNALVTFYNSTNGANWTNHTNWLSTTTPCSWFGVTCTNNQVTSLALFQNRLSGSLPPELGNLTNLTVIEFCCNQLTGNIPAQLGNLTKLTNLTLSDNQLSGNIPPQLGSLTNLTDLTLGYNQLTGSLPPQLGNLTHLTGLSVSTNQLSGNVPSELGNLVNLTYLLLNNNSQFSGPLPSNLTNLTQLNEFWFDHTQLCEPSTPTFQAWLTTISSLARTGVKCNTPPVANAQNVTTAQNTPINIAITATDAEGDPLTYIVVSNPSHGTLSGTVPNLTYTPNGGFSGTDGFTFKANDGKVDSNIATINITVSAPPTTFSIAGRVIDTNNNPIPDVTVSAGTGHTTTTDANGNFTLSGLAAGTYTLIFTKTGYTFSPTSQPITVPPDAHDINFTGAQSQAATLFVVSTQGNGSTNQIFRYKVGPADTPSLDLTIADPSFNNPFGMAFNDTGELFVTNRGSSSGGSGQGSISRFLNPQGNPSLHGVITSNLFNRPHGAIFRNGELFTAQATGTNVLRFIFDSAGNASSNGTITPGLCCSTPRGITVNPTTSELFVTQCCGVSEINRYLLDASGNVVPNGTITGGGLSNPHDMVFSSWGELFVANAGNNSVSRFIFDAAHNASPNGQLTGNGLNGPVGLDFSPWGELFVANQFAASVSRWTFNASHNASPNGLFSTPATLGDLQFYPASVPLTYNITGKATDANNNPISAVTISADVGHTTSTDTNGDYTLPGLTAGTYTLTPSKSGYTFSPASRSISGPPDTTGIDFVGTQQQPTCYTLTTSANPSNGGTITNNTPFNCQGNQYTQGTVVSLSATANTGYAFSQWGGEVSGNANPVSLTMDRDKSVTANFTQSAPTSTVCGQVISGVSCTGGIGFESPIFSDCRSNTLYLWQPNTLPADGFYRIYDATFAALDSPLCIRNRGNVTNRVASWSQYEHIASCDVCGTSTPQPRPVVLIHGWNDNYASWNTYLTFLQSIGLHGYPVNNIYTGYGGGNPFPIETNAQKLQDFIAGVKRDTGATQVDIVAHSMGGLIARYYIAHDMDANAPDVHQLIMLGTPNRGSLTAEANQLAFYLGVNSNPSTAELTPGSVGQFNVNNIERRGVPFYAIAGNYECPITIKSPSSNPLEGLLGFNDIAVSTQSALGIPLDGGWIFPGPTPGCTGDHRGMRSDAANDGGLEIFNRYVKPLLQGGTPGQSDVRTSNIQQANDNLSQVQFTEIQTGTLQPGVQLEFSYSSEPTDHISFIVVGQPEQMSVSLRDPNGHLITSATSDSAIQYIQMGKDVVPFTSYTISNPITGIWTTIVAATAQTLPGGTRIAVLYSLTSDVRLILSATSDIPQVNHPITILAQLQAKDAAITGAVTRGQLVGPDAATSSIMLLDDGQHNDNSPNDGIYGYQFTPIVPGLYNAMISADGINGGMSFHRRTVWAIEVEGNQLFLPLVRR